jgi:hypothetical protein
MQFSQACRGFKAKEEVEEVISIPFLSFLTHLGHIWMLDHKV